MMLLMILKIGHSGAQNGAYMDQEKIMKFIASTRKFDLSACLNIKAASKHQRDIIYKEIRYDTSDPE